MRINFSLKRAYCAGETINQDIIINLRECYSMRDVIETINHESFHAILNKIGKSDHRLDHYIIKRMDINVF